MRFGKYAPINGPAATVRKFRQHFPALNESTARTFRSRVEVDLKAAKSKGISPKKAIPRYRIKTGLPLLLADLDSMVQRYILGASNRGAVITRAGTVSAAKALLKKYPNVVRHIDLDSSLWVKSLFTRMSFVLRKFTSAKVDNPDSARKAIEYQYHYEIISKLERFQIPKTLVINLSQTPSLMVPGRKHTMALKRSKNATIAGATDKETSQPHLQSPYQEISYQCNNRYVSSCTSFHIYLGYRFTPSFHCYTVKNKEL